MSKVNILSLKPTQMALGLEEVRDKIKFLSKMSKKKLAKEIESNPIKVVKAPDKEFYIVDGHHRVFAYWCLGFKKVPVKIIHYFGTSTSFKNFWKQMIKNKWAHTYDLTGEGPQDPLYLSRDIRGVGNDPYRSLAYILREKGGYKKTDITFADFKWAQFLRKHKLLESGFNLDYERHLTRALKLAHSNKARTLPGHISEVKNKHKKKKYP